MSTNKKPVVVGIHLRSLLIKKEVASSGISVQSSISTQAAGEPQKRNHSVTVTNTLDTTQEEEEITSLKFKAKKDFLHVVSAIPMKFSSQQTEEICATCSDDLALRKVLFKSARRKATCWN